MKTHLFRRTRQSQRSRLDNCETISFSEPEQVDSDEWNRVCRRTLQRAAAPVTGTVVFAMLAARAEHRGVA